MAEAYDQDPHDPSVAKSKFQIIFSKELNLEFRNISHQDNNNESNNKIVWVRILVLKKDGDILDQVRFEIMDDTDLYYFFESTFDEEQFNEMKERDQLLIDFNGFPEEVRQLLIECQKDGKESQITINEEADSSDPNKVVATMEFLQLLELKAVEIFKIKFVPSEPAFVQDQLQYRFNQINKQLQYKKEFLKEFNKQIQSKNPTLYKNLSKSPRSSRSVKE